MLAVLIRRCIEAKKERLKNTIAPLRSNYPAQIDDVVKFLNDEVDVQRMVDLALPLSFVNYRSYQGQPRQSAPFDLPAAYAAMKLTLLPGKFVCPEFGVDGEGIDIAMEPSMLAMLRAGRVGDAYQVACRRPEGVRPAASIARPGAYVTDPIRAVVLAAALLFPLDESNYKALAERALRKPDRLETE